MAAPGKSNQKQKLSVRNKSGFRGVSWHTESRRWRVAIVGHGKKRYIGCFLDLRDAGAAYDHAARHYHGPDAAVNFVEPQEYTPAFKTPKYGCWGVNWIKRDRRWRASFKKDCRIHYCGVFKKYEDAVLAITKEREKYGC